MVHRLAIRFVLEFLRCFRDTNLGRALQGLINGCEVENEAELRKLVRKSRSEYREKHGKDSPMPPGDYVQKGPDGKTLFKTIKTTLLSEEGKEEERVVPVYNDRVISNKARLREYEEAMMPYKIIGWKRRGHKLVDLLEKVRTAMIEYVSSAKVRRVARTLEKMKKKRYLVAPSDAPDRIGAMIKSLRHLFCIFDYQCGYEVPLTDAAHRLRSKRIVENLDHKPGSSSVKLNYLTINQAPIKTRPMTTEEKTLYNESVKNKIDVSKEYMVPEYYEVSKPMTREERLEWRNKRRPNFLSKERRSYLNDLATVAFHGRVYMWHVEEYTQSLEDIIGMALTDTNDSAMRDALIRSYLHQLVHGYGNQVLHGSLKRYNSDYEESTHRLLALLHRGITTLETSRYDEFDGCMGGNSWQILRKQVRKLHFRALHLLHDLGIVDMSEIITAVGEKDIDTAAIPSIPDNVFDLIANPTEAVQAKLDKLWGEDEKKQASAEKRASTIARKPQIDVEPSPAQSGKRKRSGNNNGIRKPLQKPKDCEEGHEIRTVRPNKSKTLNNHEKTWHNMSAVMARSKYEKAVSRKMGGQNILSEPPATGNSSSGGLPKVGEKMESLILERMHLPYQELLSAIGWEDARHPRDGDKPRLRDLMSSMSAVVETYLEVLFTKVSKKWWPKEDQRLEAFTQILTNRMPEVPNLSRHERETQLTEGKDRSAFFRALKNASNGGSLAFKLATFTEEGLRATPPKDLSAFFKLLPVHRGYSTACRENQIGFMRTIMKACREKLGMTSTHFKCARDESSWDLLSPAPELDARYNPVLDAIVPDDASDDDEDDDEIQEDDESEDEIGGDTESDSDDEKEHHNDTTNATNRPVPSVLLTVSTPGEDGDTSNTPPSGEADKENPKKRKTAPRVPRVPSNKGPKLEISARAF